MAGLSGSSPVYATAADLKVYLGTEEQPADIADADALLAEASAAVRRATRTAVYALDGEQFPLRSQYRDAMHDATVLQAAALYVSGWKRATAPVSAKPRVVSKSLGGASVTYEKSSDQARAEALAAGDLAEQAWQVLYDAGLISTHVQSVRSAGARPLYRVRGLA